MDATFVRSLLRDALLVKPHQLGGNFRELLHHMLRSASEGVCSRHGYVLTDSVVLANVAPGHVEGVSLNGDVRFDVQYYASVCNPAAGTIVPGRVINTNRFGVLAHSGVMHSDGTFVPVIESFIPRQGIDALNLDLEDQDPELDGDADAPAAGGAGGAGGGVDLETLKPGDEIAVRILSTQFELGDDRITAMGQALPLGEVPKSSASVRARRVTPPPLLPIHGVGATDPLDQDQDQDLDLDQDQDQDQDANVQRPDDGPDGDDEGADGDEADEDGDDADEDGVEADEDGAEADEDGLEDDGLDDDGGLEDEELAETDLDASDSDNDDVDPATTSKKGSKRGVAASSSSAVAGPSSAAVIKKKGRGRTGAS